MSYVLDRIGPAGRFILALLISLMIAGLIVGIVATLAITAPWSLGYVGALGFLLICRFIAS